MKNNLINAIVGELILTDNSIHIDTILEKIKPILSQLSFYTDLEPVKEESTTLQKIENIITEIDKANSLIKNGLANKQLYKVIGGVIYLDIQLKKFIISLGIENLYLDMYISTLNYVQGTINFNDWTNRLNTILKRKSNP